MFVCICHAVTDLQVETAIAAGARTEEAVGEMTGAGTGCGGCLDSVCDRLLARDTSQLVTVSQRLASYALA